MWRCRKINRLISIFWGSGSCGWGVGEVDEDADSSSLHFLFRSGSRVYPHRQQIHSGVETSCSPVRRTCSDSVGRPALMANCCHSAEFPKEAEGGNQPIGFDFFVWETTVMVSCRHLVEQLYSHDRQPNSTPLPLLHCWNYCHSFA